MLYSWDRNHHSVNCVENFKVFIKHLSIDDLPKIVDKDYEQPLRIYIAHQSIIDGSFEIFKTIIHRFPSVLFQTDQFNQTYFTFLCEKPDKSSWFNEFLSIVTRDRTHQENERFYQLIFSKNENGYNCLFIALMSENYLMCKTLLQFYPDLCNESDNKNHNFLWWIVHLWKNERLDSWLKFLLYCFPLFTEKVKFHRFAPDQQNVYQFALSLKKIELAEHLLNLCPEYQIP